MAPHLQNYDDKTEWNIGRTICIAFVFSVVIKSQSTGNYKAECNMALNSLV